MRCCSNSRSGRQPPRLISSSALVSVRALSGYGSGSPFASWWPCRQQMELNAYSRTSERSRPCLPHTGAVTGRADTGEVKPPPLSTGRAAGTAAVPTSMQVTAAAPPAPSVAGRIRRSAHRAAVPQCRRVLISHVTAVDHWRFGGCRRTPARRTGRDDCGIGGAGFSRPEQATGRCRDAAASWRGGDAPDGAAIAAGTIITICTGL